MLNIEEKKKIKSVRFLYVIENYEILVFSQLLAYLDDAVKQCPTLRIKFFDVEMRQTLSLFLLGC